MTALLIGVIGGARRSSERRVTCLCGWWSQVGGEDVVGWEVWYPEVESVVCEACGERIDCSERAEEGESDDD